MCCEQDKLALQGRVERTRVLPASRGDPGTEIRPHNGLGFVFILVFLLFWIHLSRKVLCREQSVPSFLYF